MNVTRSQVIRALEALGIDPSTTDEVMIFTDKVVVRQRQIHVITDSDSEPDHAGGTPANPDHNHGHTHG